MRGNEILKPDEERLNYYITHCLTFLYAIFDSNRISFVLKTIFSAHDCQLHGDDISIPGVRSNLFAEYYYYVLE